MKKLLALSALFFLISINSIGQIINTSQDSIKKLLCHKWGVRAIIMGEQEMTNMNETLTYEFFHDYTLKRITDKKTETGTWTYDPDKNAISLKIKKVKLAVKKLREGDLVITPDHGPDAANNPLGIATALKITN